MNEIIKLLRSFWEWMPTVHSGQISKDQHRTACVIAGLTAKVVSIAIMLSGTFIGGYSAINSAKTAFGFQPATTVRFAELWPRIVVVHLIAGALLGLLLHIVSFRSGSKALSRRSRSLRLVFVLLVGLLVGGLAKQLGARNALFPCGTPLLIVKGDGSNYESTGGPLGTPDFETIANAISVAALMLLTANLLLRVKVPTRDQAFRAMLSIPLMVAAAYGVVHVFYKTVISLGVASKGATWLSECLFKVDFPHPERIVTVVIATLVHTLVLVALLWVPNRIDLSDRRVLS